MMGVLRELSKEAHQSAAKCLIEQGSPFARSLGWRIKKAEVVLYEVEPCQGGCDGDWQHHQAFCIEVKP